MQRVLLYFMLVLTLATIHAQAGDEVTSFESPLHDPHVTEIRRNVVRISVHDSTVVHTGEDESDLRRNTPDSEAPHVPGQVEVAEHTQVRTHATDTPKDKYTTVFDSSYQRRLFHSDVSRLEPYDIDPDSVLVKAKKQKDKDIATLKADIADLKEGFKKQRSYIKCLACTVVGLSVVTVGSIITFATLLAKHTHGT